MTWDEVVRIAAEWPEVERALSYGEPSLKVRGRLLARQRAADDSLVLLGVPPEERDHLALMFPGAFFHEPHYEGYDIVLARLKNCPPDVVARILERHWRALATKRAVRTQDAARRDGAAAPPARG